MDENYDLLPEMDEIPGMIVRILTGDATLATDFIRYVNSISDKLLYRKLFKFFNTINDMGTNKKIIAKKLAQSNYSKEYGAMLLHYINVSEHSDKGKYMAYLLDAVVHDFISQEECFRFCKLISDISYTGLSFIKAHIIKHQLSRACWLI